MFRIPSLRKVPGFIDVKSKDAGWMMQVQQGYKEWAVQQRP
jgi:hypothetical protein